MPVFDRFGRSLHLRLRDAADLEAALHLDAAQWVATAASTRTLDADPVLLERLDADGDGFVRADDVRRALERLLRLSSDREAVTAGRTALALDALDADTPEGRALQETARKVLRRAGRSEADAVELAQVRAVRDALVERGLSEAGRVPPEAASDEATRRLLQDVVDAAGERAGEPPAVTEALLDAFLAEAHATLAWRDRAVDRAALRPLGDATAEAHALVEALAPKLEQYFTLSEAVQLDPALAERVWPGGTRLDAVDFTEADAVRALLDAAPPARPDPRGVLDFEAPINPRYADTLGRLRADVLAPLLGGPPDVLGRADWRRVQERLAPYAAWRRDRPDTPVAALPPERLRAHLDDPTPVERVRALLEESHREAVALDDVRRLEELLLYQAHLLRFVNSFVSFPHLYDPHDRALFEMGTLVMDGRRFELCVRVTDRAQHVRFSDDSHMYVLYVSVRRREGEERYEVAVPVTAGGRGTLRVGKRGVFYDRDGLEHHAQVVHLVENPISLGEALMRPFRRLGEAMSAAVERVSAERERRLLERGERAIGQAAATPAAAPGTLATPASGTATPPSTAASLASTPTGLLAGGAVALAALGSSFAFVARTLGALSWPALLGGVLVLALAVLVPVAVVAGLRLRRRDLSAILEGSDWAVNARMRLTRSQARTFTTRPPYPGAPRRRARWLWALTVLALLAVLLLLTGTG